MTWRLPQFAAPFWDSDLAGDKIIPGGEIFMLPGAPDGGSKRWYATAYNQGRIRDMAQSEIIFSVQESLEGGYQARALGFSIFTDADSLDELKSMIRDVVSCHFDAADRPSVIRLHVVKHEVIPA